MTPNKATLSNGLRVLHVPVDDSQMVYVNLLYVFIAKARHTNVLPY